MALTDVTLNFGQGTTAELKIDGNAVGSVTSPYTTHLQQGQHTVELTFANGFVLNKTLNVPKAVEDIVQEEIQSQGLKTPAEVQEAIENTLAVAQYVKLNKYDENNNTAEFFIDAGITPTAIKYRITNSDDTTTTNNIPNNSAISIAIGSVKKLEILAGNNKVIDKIDLSTLITDTTLDNSYDLIKEPLASHYITSYNPVQPLQSFEDLLIAGSHNVCSIYFEVDNTNDTVETEWEIGNIFEATLSNSNIHYTAVVKLKTQQQASKKIAYDILKIKVNGVVKAIRPVMLFNYSAISTPRYDLNHSVTVEQAPDSTHQGRYSTSIYNQNGSVDINIWTEKGTDGYTDYAGQDVFFVNPLSTGLLYAVAQTEDPDNKSIKVFIFAGTNSNDDYGKKYYKQILFKEIYTVPKADWGSTEILSHHITIMSDTNEITNYGISVKYNDKDGVEQLWRG